MSDPTALINAVGWTVAQVGNSVKFCARHPREVATAAAAVYAGLAVRRELLETGFRVGSQRTLLRPTDAYLAALLEEMQEAEASRGKEQKEVATKTVELGSGGVAFAKAVQIMDRWSMLKRVDGVVLAVLDAPGATGEEQGVAIASKSGLAWSTGTYRVSRTRLEGDEETGTLSIWLQTEQNCGWRGTLELTTAMHKDKSVDFEVKILVPKGKRPPREATRLAQNLCDGVETEFAAMMRAYEKAASIKEKYEASKLKERERKERRARDRALNPEKYRQRGRPGGRAAEGGGRWLPSESAMSRRSVQTVTSSSTCVAGS